jgi:dihydrofolate reductase
MVEFARIWRDMPKIVFSRTLEKADWNTTILRRVDAAEIRALQAEPGGDLALGGAELARSFFEQDLIDELRLYVHPVLIGRGKRLFPEAEGYTPLHLNETRTFGNGVVMLHYTRP